MVVYLFEQAQDGGEVRPGDVITKIADYDARDLRHEDAQNLFRSAGNTISLVVQRYVAADFGIYTKCYRGFT
jgi:C-terminal processing protease CtpA/Prc